MRARRKAAQDAASAELDALRGTDNDEASTLTDFGDSAGTFFEVAWGDPTSVGGNSPGDSESGDARYDQFAAIPGNEVETERSEARLASFTKFADRRVRASIVLIAILVVGLAGLAAWTLMQQLTEVGSDEQEQPAFEVGLVSVSETRHYAEAGPHRLAGGATLDERLLDDGNGNLTRLEPPETTVSFLPVIWGGRMNILIVGQDVGAPGTCAVAALVDDALRTVDVAAVGDSCDRRFAATGDRTSCRSNNAVLVEVWLAMESRSNPAGSPFEVRARIDGADGVSQRGTLQLDTGQRLAELGGQPMDTTFFALDGSNGTCTLLDREGVVVQLL